MSGTKNAYAQLVEALGDAVSDVLAANGFDRLLAGDRWDIGEDVIATLADADVLHPHGEVTP